jgi:hypothetical protein
MSCDAMCDSHRTHEEDGNHEFLDLGLKTSATI